LCATESIFDTHSISDAGQHCF